MADSVQTYNLSGILGDAVEKGRQGYNIGIPFTIPRLNMPTGGIMRGMYYLILGASKTGKSSFLYDQFIFNLADLIMTGKLDIDDVEIILYSLEIDRVMIAAKAAVRYLFRHKKILTSIKKLLGVYGKTPSALVSVMNDKGFQKYLNIVDRITTIFTIANPAMMYNYIKKRCEEQSYAYGKDSEGRILYKFRNEKKIVIAAVDHVALVHEMPGDSLKKTIDGVSKKVFVDMKRQYGITPVVIQQVNPVKTGEGQKKLIYGHGDVRDSKNTFQDCDICIAIGSPFHEEIASVRFKNNMYYIRPDAQNNDMGLLDRFRLFGIEKDRYGDSAVKIASAYIGEVGLFSGIAEPDEIDYEFYELKEWQRL
jgi:hypothetical protein